MAIFDAFLKIDGVNGEIKGEIQLESFSWGVSNPASLEREAAEQLKLAAKINVAIVSHDGGSEMMTR